ncbi:hypothetical protein ASPSYDRAFT_51187 [Aspergillus sydowii CBS 593.65]|uniref:Uncharacterized protein n=1 Tax=Aspergillus sydowii CBS 593.65 TaxID=1036612 RepID=A0A1L9T0U3_9EURO|nr:uncharacterized protein ASPSYDRAFT_51187 [Aspergillus sydowii CBS 593.65]OJJ53084.1 hypothetical protein ASPSYDRAFT_51187 [Aspergillus sydowii CBS 593.65]
MAVVEAKRRGQALKGIHQAQAYLGMIHHARKKAGRANMPIYRISPDGYVWFLYTWVPKEILRFIFLAWNQGKQVEIISHVHKILEQSRVSFASLNQYLGPTDDS